MNIGQLREALISFMDLNGAWGANMHESKQALIRVGGKIYPLESVSASFHEGSFVVMLDGVEQ